MRDRQCTGVVSIRSKVNLQWHSSKATHLTVLDYFLFVCFGRVSLRSEDFHASWVHWPMSLRHPPIFAFQAVR